MISYNLPIYLREPDHSRGGPGGWRYEECVFRVYVRLSFKTSCSTILLFVDFYYEESVRVAKMCFGTAEVLQGQWLFVFHPIPPDPIHSSNAYFHLDEIIRERMLLIFDRIMYLILAGVSFITLFLVPLPIP
jgi:hypothetical protein